MWCLIMETNSSFSPGYYPKWQSNTAKIAYNHSRAVKRKGIIRSSLTATVAYLFVGYEIKVQGDVQNKMPKASNSWLQKLVKLVQNRKVAVKAPTGFSVFVNKGEKTSSHSVSMSGINKNSPGFSDMGNRRYDSSQVSEGDFRRPASVWKKEFSDPENGISFRDSATEKKLSINRRHTSNDGFDEELMTSSGFGSGGILDSDSEYSDDAFDKASLVSVDSHSSGYGSADDLGSESEYEDDLNRIAFENMQKEAGVATSLSDELANGLTSGQTNIKMGKYPIFRDDKIVYVSKEEFEQYQSEEEYDEIPLKVGLNGHVRSLNQSKALTQAETPSINEKRSFQLKLPEKLHDLVARFSKKGLDKKVEMESAKAGSSLSTQLRRYQQTTDKDQIILRDFRAEEDFDLTNLVDQLYGKWVSLTTECAAQEARNEKFEADLEKDKDYDLDRGDLLKALESKETAIKTLEKWSVGGAVQGELGEQLAQARHERKLIKEKLDGLAMTDREYDERNAELEKGIEIAEILYREQLKVNKQLVSRLEERIDEFKARLQDIKEYSDINGNTETRDAEYCIAEINKMNKVLTEVRG